MNKRINPTIQITSINNTIPIVICNPCLKEEISPYAYL